MMDITSGKNISVYPKSLCVWERERVSEWVSEWESEKVREWVREWESEWVRHTLFSLLSFLSFLFSLFFSPLFSEFSSSLPAELHVGADEEDWQQQPSRKDRAQCKEEARVARGLLFRAGGLGLEGLGLEGLGLEGLGLEGLGLEGLGSEGLGLEGLGLEGLGCRCRRKDWGLPFRVKGLGQVFSSFCFFWPASLLALWFYQISLDLFHFCFCIFTTWTVGHRSYSVLSVSCGHKYIIFFFTSSTVAPPVLLRAFSLLWS